MKPEHHEGSEGISMVKRPEKCICQQCEDHPLRSSRKGAWQGQRVKPLCRGADAFPLGKLHLLFLSLEQM